MVPSAATNTRAHTVMMDSSKLSEVIPSGTGKYWMSKMMQPAPTAGKVSSGRFTVQQPVTTINQNTSLQRQISSIGMATILAATVAVAPANAGNIGEGKQIFEGNCAACHAGGQNVILNEKTLQKDALTEYLAGGFKEASIITQVTNGKNAMPAFGGRLSDEDI